MDTSPELLALAIAAVAFGLGVLFVRWKARRTRSVGLRVAHGPANLRYVCAGCSQRFTHSRRTLSAWRQGTRQFYCKACYTRGRRSLPATPTAPTPGGRVGPHNPDR